MDLGFSLASYFLLFLTLLYILNVLKSWNKNHVPNFPPGPRCWPLIGNLHLMDIKKPQRTYLELAKKYGPVFSVQMGMKKMVVLTGYETVKEALVNNAEEFGERGLLEIFKKMDNGFGLVSSQGENWKVMRRFTISTLRDFGMGKSSIEEKVIDEVAHLSKYFASFKGKPFDNTMILNGAVANIIVAILLGYRMDYDDSQFRRLLSLTNENVRLLGTPMVSLINMFPFLEYFPGSHKTIEKNVEELYDFIRKTFVEHLKNLDENDQRSFIDAFLVRQKEVKGIVPTINITDRSILLVGKRAKSAEYQIPIFPTACDYTPRDLSSEDSGTPQSYFHNENLLKVVRNLFAAGMETTSTTLRWGLLLMMKYPKIQGSYGSLHKDCSYSQKYAKAPHAAKPEFQCMLMRANKLKTAQYMHGFWLEKVQEEISRVVGSAQPMYSHRGQMPFTNAVVHEIQRFSDIVPLNLSHETTKDVTFKGYFIPKGTFIIPLLTSVLKDMTQFEKPEEFYPYHFLDSKGDFIKKDAFMPFSAGRRACAGETLARMELFIFFSSLLQNFTFSPPSGVTDLDLVPIIGITNAPKPHLICAMPR